MNYREVDLNEDFLSKLYEPESQHWKNRPPERLFVVGEFPKERATRKVVSIVGSRASTPYGEQIAYEAAKLLAENDVIIVSGLAYGIDAAAHRGCLDGGGETVAVLGTPIDKIYPACNRSLAERMLDGSGAIVSEYAPGDEVFRGNFTYRNRIVSGLADYLLVVEATLWSGTMATVAYALEQHRDVYAVPGDIDRESSAGTNKIILDGAKVYLGAKEFLDEVVPDWRARKSEELAVRYSDNVQRIFMAIKDGGNTIEKLSKALDCSPAELTAKLGLLEIEGLVRVEGERIRLVN
jgi:DNA processing protein